MRAALLLLAAPALAQEPVPARFVEEIGVESVYQGDWEHMVGGGVAAFDCSGDGFPDLAFAGGSDPASLWLNESAQGGELAFARVASGIELADVTGAYPLDVDGDGVTDLAVLRLGESVLMRGLGNCRFERANEAWGFDGGDAWATAFSATWEEGSDWPTLALGAYIDRAEDLFPWGSCTPNTLHRPDGEGFAPPVPLLPSHCALSMLFTDWGRTGTQDLRVSNDREYYKGGAEQLWRMGATPTLYGDADGWQRLRVWGMGIAGRDIDGDGLSEYALTSMADNKLQALVPQDGPLRLTYADVAYARGAIAQRPYTGGDVRPSTAWHAEWADVNNDAHPDLFIAKGNVAEMPDFAALDPNNLLLLRPDGTFAEGGLEAGIASMDIGRGATLADLNLDGLPDLVTTARWTPARVYRNVTEGAGHWLHLRLQAPGANRDAVGAFIEVRAEGRTQAIEVTVGGGHAGGRLGWHHLGLGAAATAEVRVLWPDAAPGPWESLPADGLFVLAPDAPARPWSPG